MRLVHIRSGSEIALFVPRGTSILEGPCQFAGHRERGNAYNDPQEVVVAHGLRNGGGEQTWLSVSLCPCQCWQAMCWVSSSHMLTFLTVLLLDGEGMIFKSALAHTGAHTILLTAAFRWRPSLQRIQGLRGWLTLFGVPPKPTYSSLNRFFISGDMLSSFFLGCTQRNGCWCQCKLTHTHMLLQGIITEIGTPEVRAHCRRGLQCLQSRCWPVWE
eukprot:1159425-Pelagomonas_calceolata.AAC.7